MAAEIDYTTLLNERQQGVNDFQSCVLGNQTADWLQKVVKECLAPFIGKMDYSTLPASFWKWVSPAHQQSLAMSLG